MKIVKVDWLDSTSQQDGWTYEDPKNIKPMKLSTVGFLLHSDDDKIVISHSVAVGTNAKYSMFTIPQSVIIEYSEIGKLE